MCLSFIHFRLGGMLVVLTQPARNSKMKNNIDITQLAFQFLHHNPPQNSCNEAEFLCEVQRLRARFADLLELSPSELERETKAHPSNEWRHF
ncbi:hypothetical protein FYT06_18890 [Escherichia coli]|nr:hypothetical protein [Escherichia coli]